MKSVHEILIDDKLTRLNREADEKRLARIISSYRTPIWIWLAGVTASPILATIILLFDPAKVHKIYYAASVFLFILSLIQLIVAVKKREDALLDVIEQFAPDIVQQLRK